MYPQPFSALVKQWLADAEHPRIARVQTHAEVGRWEQPAGVKVTLDDGWAWLVQFVGSYSPPIGKKAAPQPPPPAGAYVQWGNREDYQQARAVADREASATAKAPRGARPGMRGGEVLAILLDVIKRADHPEVTGAEVAPTTRYAVNRDYLRVLFEDGTKVTGMVAGVIPPNSSDFNHPPHDIPKELI